MNALIQAARARAQELRKAATGDPSEYGARVTEAEATRWDELADRAERETL